MKEYDFYTSNGHGGQLDFIQSYYQQLQSTPAAPTASAAGSPKK
jgi:hypothetical protein